MTYRLQHIEWTESHWIYSLSYFAALFLVNLRQKNIDFWGSKGKERPFWCVLIPSYIYTYI